MKDEWIEKLRSRLENHEETPPQGLFADIQKKMSQQQKAPSAPEKRRTLFPQHYNLMFFINT